MDSPTLLHADQLLRLHIISAHLTKEKEHQNVYSIVTIGNKAARTDPRPLVGPKDAPKDITWDEHFAIEYGKSDDESVIKVEVFSKGTLSDDLLGEFKLRLGDIDPPKNKEKSATKDKKKEKEEKKDSWATAKPRESPLTDKKGAQVGTITIRIRRESKLYGTLTVNLKEVDLDSSIHADMEALKCVIKLGTQSHETTVSEGKNGKKSNHFTWKDAPKQFEVNNTNHVYDVFIEIWKADAMPKDKKTADAIANAATPNTTAQAGTDGNSNKPTSSSKGKVEPILNPLVLGQARLTLYDSRSKFSQPLPITTYDFKTIGQLKLQAKLKTDKDGHKKAVKREEETKK